MKTISQIIPRKTQPPTNGHKKPELDVLELFQTNLYSMLEWYRNQQGQGRELGHFVIMEMCLSHMTNALQDARNGKEWRPPA